VKTLSTNFIKHQIIFKMITIIKNDLRVFQVVTSAGEQYFCNDRDLNSIINYNNLKKGCYRIYDFWKNKPRLCKPTFIKEYFKTNNMVLNFDYSIN